MEVPHQYPYNPPLRSILLVFGSGLLWIAGEWLPYVVTSTDIPGFRFWLGFIGLILIAVALIIGIRRMCVEHYLLLDRDSMELPMGLFQMRTATIEYSSITSVWRHYLPHGTLVLQVATEKGTFKIVPSFLSNNGSYDALEQFLNRKALENTSREKVPKNWLTNKSP